MKFSMLVANCTIAMTTHEAIVIQLKSLSALQMPLADNKIVKILNHFLISLCLPMYNAKYSSPILALTRSYQTLVLISIRQMYRVFVQHSQPELQHYD